MMQNKTGCLWDGKEAVEEGRHLALPLPLSRVSLFLSSETEACLGLWRWL